MKNLIKLFFVNLCLGSVALAVAPQWKLSGLDKSFIVYKNVPSQQCLQEAVDRISMSFDSKKAHPQLVSDIFKVSKAYGLDPILLLGLVYQESGDFKPHTSINGTGVAQMTRIAVKDACFNLETTSCSKDFDKKNLANTSYEEVWQRKTMLSIKSLFNIEQNFESNYPWRKYCQSNPLKQIDRCNSNCGLTNDCYVRISKAMMDDHRVNLNLAGHVLLNYLGQAEENIKTASLIEKYRYAFENYNGHPKYKKAYPGKIFSRLNEIKSYCNFN